MTLFSMRSALALCLAASLAACGGGGKATFVVGGSVYALAYDGLVLQTGSQLLTVKANVLNGVPQTVPYAFPQTIEYGDVYSVVVKTSPDKQVCTAFVPSSNNSGTDSAGHTATINVAVNCVTNKFALGGKVENLTGTGLVLINGSADGTLPVSPAATGFTFASTVQVDVAYGVSVLTQPSGQTCTVKNGTGIMPNNALTDTTANPIVVSCINN